MKLRSKQTNQIQCVKMRYKSNYFHNRHIAYHNDCVWMSYRCNGISHVTIAISTICSSSTPFVLAILFFSTPSVRINPYWKTSIWNRKEPNSLRGFEKLSVWQLTMHIVHMVRYLFYISQNCIIQPTAASCLASEMRCALLRLHHSASWCPQNRTLFFCTRPLDFPGINLMAQIFIE